MARGIERRELFTANRDYEDFLSRLARLLPVCNVQCFNWALMPNHIHLMLRSGVQGISRMLQRLLGGYAIKYNLRYQRVGHLFQNRFKSLICEDDPYFLELVRYISLNPVRAKIVSSVEELRRYPWTGHAAIMGDFKLEWQSTSAVLERWGSDISVARQRYTGFLQAGLRENNMIDFDTAGVPITNEKDPLQDRRILGSSEFIEEVRNEVLASESDLLEPPKLEMDAILAGICAQKQIEPSELLSAARTRRASEAKAVLIYQGVELGGKTLRFMAKLTGMSSSAATRAYRRGKTSGT